MKWISVEDRLPIQMPENIPTMDWVLVTYDDAPYPVTIARFNGDQWEFLHSEDSCEYAPACGDCVIPFNLDYITHWMPLPKLPEQKEQGEGTAKWIGFGKTATFKRYKKQDD